MVYKSNRNNGSVPTVIPTVPVLSISICTRYLMPSLSIDLSIPHRPPCSEGMLYCERGLYLSLFLLSHSLLSTPM